MESRLKTIHVKFSQSLYGCKCCWAIDWDPSMMCKGNSVLTCVTDIIPIDPLAVPAAFPGRIGCVDAQRPGGFDLSNQIRMSSGRSSACSNIPGK
jgi:hypothetical protein